MLLVDTYNVLHTAGVLPPHLAGIEVDGLARLLARSRYAPRRKILVCDGQPRSAALLDSGKPLVSRAVLHGSQVLYAGSGRSADDLIERLLESDPAPRRLLVVSTDRRIRRAASRRGADSIPSSLLLEHLAADDARPPKTLDPPWVHEIPLDPFAVRHWMDEIDLDAPTLAALEAEAARAPLPDGAKPAPFDPPPPPAVTPARRERPPSKPREPNFPSAPRGLADPELIDLLRSMPGIAQPDELDMARWLAREARRDRRDV